MSIFRYYCITHLDYQTEFQMTKFLELPWYLSAFFIVFLFISIALIGLYITRKYTSPKSLKSNHDIAGYTFGIIGVIYAVLLGFVAVNVNEDYHNAERAAEQEAIMLIDLFRDAEVFNPRVRDKIRDEITSYTEYVIDKEWNKLAQGISNPPAIMHNLWKAYTSINPQTEREKIWLAESVSKLNDFSNIRLARIYNSKGSVGSMMWTFLIAGAFIITAFMYFFYAESIIAQGLMSAFLTGTVAFMLFLIFQLSNIYYGDISVQPVYLQKALHFFQHGGDLGYSESQIAYLWI